MPAWRSTGQRSQLAAPSGERTSPRGSRTGVVRSLGLGLISVVVGSAMMFIAADGFVLPLLGRAAADSFKALSLALIPALLVVLYDHYKTINDATKHFEDVVEDKLDEMVHARLVGLRTIRSELDFPEMFRGLGRGDELLWLDTYCPEDPKFWGALGQALCGTDVRLRMLIIEPGCTNADYRADEIAEYGSGLPTEEFRPDKFKDANSTFLQRAIDNLKNFERTDRSVNERAVVRTYEDLPGMPMYLIRNRETGLGRGYSSLFLSRPTVESFHFEWEPAAPPYGVLAMLDSYFQRKWDRNAWRTVYPPDSKAKDPMAGADILARLQQLAGSSDLEASLSRVGKMDSKVGIRVARVEEHNGVEYYVAAIPAGGRVTPHVHRHGSELYLLVKGHGVMGMGQATEDAAGPGTHWEVPTRMQPGIPLVVPEGWTHSLASSSKTELRFVFACPPAHMRSIDEGGDRETMPAPETTGEAR
jgi:mannose-6-phosphate isomerase-like protein (cupin superfamily)